MRSNASLSLAVALAACCSSCASLDRLGRLSPLVGDAAADRISLWPLVYHNGQGTAVAWPFFDVDPRGFALRPLIAHDDSTWEFLYPWFRHDTRSGNGWAFPAYWIGDSKGLFPLFHFGAFNFFGPVFWSGEHASSSYGGLFPLALFGDFSYVGPVWWSSTEPHSGGLFPLAHFGAFNYVGPLWWQRDEPGFGVFPVFGTADTRHVGPVWWKREPDERRAWGVFPLVWCNADASTFTFAPFYAHQLSAESRTRTYLLGLARTHSSPDETQNWLLPFFYEHERGDDADTALLPFYWKRKRGDETQVFTLLGNRRVEDDGGSFNLYPLWWSSHTRDASSKMLLPLFYYAEDGDERTLLTPLGGRGWSASGASRYVNVLGPLYHHSESVDGVSERTAVVWPLFEREREGTRTTTRSMPFFSNTSDGENSEGWFALGLGHHRSSASESSHRLWPLYSTSNVESGPGLLYDLTLYGHRAYGDTEKHRLFPLFWSSRTGDDFVGRYLLGFGGYARRGAARSWYAWPLASSTSSVEDESLLGWLTLFGHSEFEGHEETHAFSPFVFVRTRRTDARRTRLSTRLLTVLGWSSAESRAEVIPDGRGLSTWNRVRESEQSLLFGLFAHQNETYRVWREDSLTDEEARVLAPFADNGDSRHASSRDTTAARAVLARHGHVLESEELPALQQAARELADEATELVERSQLRLPLIFNYESKPDSVEWSGPLWLVNSRTRPGSSKFNVLFYAYRSETSGDQTRRDIFPFITWDSSPRTTEVSFLWRLFRYRSEGERSGGHILFVPWGDA